jgi:phosphatidylethanolamine/phosphatidyl-N-methylethanolamine N-methyltransferase
VAFDLALRCRDIHHDPRTQWREGIGFFREWLRNPRGVAAIAPSSRALAELITRDIVPGGGSVLELGPGTGAFTQALIARGIPEENLVLLENSERFATALRLRFPNAYVVQADAIALADHLGSKGNFGAVVCGLGLLNMAPAEIRSILVEAFAQLRSGSAFFLFTYGRRCSVPANVMEELGLTASLVGRTYRNLPPASVFRILQTPPV